MRLHYMRCPRTVRDLLGVCTAAESIKTKYIIYCHSIDSCMRYSEIEILVPLIGLSCNIGDFVPSLSNFHDYRQPPSHQLSESQSAKLTRRLFTWMITSHVWERTYLVIPVCLSWAVLVKVAGAQLATIQHGESFGVFQAVTFFLITANMAEVYEIHFSISDMKSRHTRLASINSSRS